MHMPWVPHEVTGGTQGTFKRIPACKCALLELVLLRVRVESACMLPCMSNARVHMQVHVRVTIPQKLSKEEQKLVEELRELQDSSSSKRSRIFNFGS